MFDEYAQNPHMFDKSMDETPTDHFRSKNTNDVKLQREFT